MSVTRRQVAASPEQVFAVLADGWLYASWVVGAARIRDVDAGWPAAGTRIHHSIGAWPAFLHDVSLVVEADPPRMLLLEVRVRPAGRGRVRFTMREHDGGTEVTMAEEPTTGPVRWLHNRALDALIGARNRETLLRLGWLAQGRAGQR
jgi:uncharacterized protein YndB with AHSA1/START domain